MDLAPLSSRDAAVHDLSNVFDAREAKREKHDEARCDLIAGKQLASLTDSGGLPRPPDRAERLSRLRRRAVASPDS